MRRSLTVEDCVQNLRQFHLSQGPRSTHPLYHIRHRILAESIKLF